MGSYIAVKAEVKNEHMKEFLLECLKKYMLIDVQYYDEKDDTSNVFLDPEVMGYAEPMAFYDKVKDYVVDVWYLILGDSFVKAGEDDPEYYWQSCMKQRESGD